jgi:hypothetical protein
MWLGPKVPRRGVGAAKGNHAAVEISTGEVRSRTHSLAMQDTIRQLFEASNNKEARKIIAGQNFAKRNCGLL